jgi:hypothetical protein
MKLGIWPREEEKEAFFCVPCICYRFCVDEWFVHLRQSLAMRLCFEPHSSPRLHYDSLLLLRKTLPRIPDS